MKIALLGILLSLTIAISCTHDKKDKTSARVRPDCSQELKDDFNRLVLKNFPDESLSALAPKNCGENCQAMGCKANSELEEFMKLPNFNANCNISKDHPLHDVPFATLNADSKDVCDGKSLTPRLKI